MVTSHTSHKAQIQADPSLWFTNKADHYIFVDLTRTACVLCDMGFFEEYVGKGIVKFITKTKYRLAHLHKLITESESQSANFFE